MIGVAFISDGAPVSSLRFRLALSLPVVAVAFGLSCGGALAQFSDIADPPEDALPPLPPVLRAAPSGPEHAAPTPQELLKECENKDFVACIRNWKPPEPPPPPPEPPKPTAEEEKAREEEEARRRAAAAPPPPPQPGDPREPAVGGPLVGKPPPPNPAADRATLDALARAIRDAGLGDKIKLPDAPTDGNVQMKIDDGRPADPAGDKK